MDCRSLKRSGSWSSEEDHEAAANALEISCDSLNSETLIPLNVINEEHHDGSDFEESSSFGGRIEGGVRRDEEGGREEERENKREKKRERKREKKEKTDGRSRLPKKNKFDIPLPLNYPHTITFMYDKSTMEGTIRPPTKANEDIYTFSIRMKTVHNPSTTWPVPMSFHVSLVHKGSSLWSNVFGAECDGSKNEFCTINIPKTVFEQCEKKVKLHLSM